MRTLCFLIVAAMPLTTQAGYEEFEVIDFSSCKAYTLTSNWGDAYFESEAERTKWYTQDEKVLKASHDASWEATALFGPDFQPRYLGLCNWGETTIQCDGISPYPLPGLSCMRPESKANLLGSSTCTVQRRPNANVRIYGVDTGEYELEGQPKVNKRYLRAIKQLRLQCGKNRAVPRVKP